jgi:hypothetical protein
MGKVYAEIDEALVAFLRKQHVFFVATAPLSADGHINLSPKGLATFAIIDPRTVAYLDLTGSGIETVAHLNENGRIVILFCAFDGPPKIVRLHGVGRALTPGTTEFDQLRPSFPAFEAARAIVRVELNRISDSCGYAVPLFEYAGEREQLSKWAANKGADGIREYRAKNNARSIDGLRGLQNE